MVLHIVDSLANCGAGMHTGDAVVPAGVGFPEMVDGICPAARFRNSGLHLNWWTSESSPYARPAIGISRRSWDQM